MLYSSLVFRPSPHHTRAKPSPPHALTKQGDELVHAVGQGCRDEAEAGCVTVDQVRVSARAFKCLLEVTLHPIHSKLKGANAS